MRVYDEISESIKEIKNFSVIYKEIKKLLNVDTTYQEKVRNLKYKVQLIMDKNNNVLNSYIHLIINDYMLHQ